MAVAFTVHPGAVAPYERLMPAELKRLAPQVVASGTLRDHYARLARGAARVLEYGAGRGALTWALARRGVRVTAVDLSAALLDDLLRQGQRESPSVAKRVTAVQGDMRTFRASTRFPLVIAPEGTLLHLYNRKDVEAFLVNVRRHLAPRGRFVFDVPLPAQEVLAEDYDPVAQIRYQNLGGGILLAQRQFQPRELEMLLWYNGFREIRIRARRLGDDEGADARSGGKQVLLVTARDGSPTRRPLPAPGV